MLYTITVNVIKFKINHSPFFRNLEKSEYVLRVVLTDTFFLIKFLSLFAV